MAVTTPREAQDAVRRLIFEQPIAVSEVLRHPYLPDGMTAHADQPRTMGDDTAIGGYGQEERYEFPPDVAELIAGPPSGLSRDSLVEPAHENPYLTASLDLTMQGGTTSGVVYPLAICELATAFRFRNVGGASAGAIAAAITAAAELGRSERARGHSLGFVSPAPPDPPGVPRVRPGFTGLADLMTWLTQVSPDGAEPDEEYRLAQLFRPGPTTHPTFRVLISVMRGRTWPLPLLALMAFGWVTRTLTVLLLLATVVLTGWIGSRFAGVVRPWYETAGLGLVDVAAFVVTVTGLVLCVQGVVNLGRYRAEGAADRMAANTPLGALRQHTSGARIPRTAFLTNSLVGLALILLGALAAVFGPWPYAAAWFVGLAGASVVVVVLVVSILQSVNTFRDVSYGLIGGSADRRPQSWLDWLGAVPKPTVANSLVPWLNDCLTQLAGLPDQTVLRFGHLWDGAGYQFADPTEREENLRRWRAMWGDTERRLVNLELMTTDLTRRRPYRFPLTPTRDSDGEPVLDPSEELWLRVDQLRAAGTFPEPVLRALEESYSCTLDDGHGHLHTYHRLPDPWDLPVIFAVRMSMALPALFQAIPLHRLIPDSPLRDDLGRAILRDGVPLTTFTVDRAQTPADLAPAAGQVPWATSSAPPPSGRPQELWFSDGGITSNFPVHFFDAPLPRWPTVSLNLGGIPDTDPVQDVWLPADWDQIPIPLQPLARSGLSVAGAALDTAMSWRDNMQSAMQGYRNRIAQVRARPDEGGTNLFMTTSTIASLALRGAVAGARLRMRYSDAAQWDRFRWLRMRVALNNMEELRVSTAARRGFYADALGDRTWLPTLENAFGVIPAPVPPTRLAKAPDPWYTPGGSFWPDASQLLQNVANAYTPAGVDAMTCGVPEPEPVLRQVPQE